MSHCRYLIKTQSMIKLLVEKPVICVHDVYKLFAMLSLLDFVFVIKSSILNLNESSGMLTVANFWWQTLHATKRSQLLLWSHKTKTLGKNSSREEDYINVHLINLYITYGIISSWQILNESLVSNKELL